MENLHYGWYRPWSRELHFWWLQRCFGARELPFHAANLALAFGVLAAYYAFARRLAGADAAAVSAAGVAALAALGVPVVWAAGAQDLWMLLLALLALHAWERGRIGLSALALIGALLSKETAVVLPALLAAYDLIAKRRPMAGLPRRLLPLVVVVVSWAALHPLLGGRFMWPRPAPSDWGEPLPLQVTSSRTLLALFNLDLWPRPEPGWVYSVAVGLVPALALAVLVLNQRAMAPAPPIAEAADPRESPAVRRTTSGRIAGFAAAWAALGWLPLLMPGLSWQPYYTLFGALGAWLAIGWAASSRPRMAAALVAAVALIRPARAATPAFDWGSEWYHHRAAAFLGPMLSSLRHLHPTLPHDSRLYFMGVPNNVGFLSGSAAAVRVLYGDSTLHAGYLSAYRPRAPGVPRGDDYFFRFDSTRIAWVELIEANEDTATTRAANPSWKWDHQALAEVLVRAGEWPRAGAEYAKLATQFPGDVDYAFNAGVCAENQGDSTAAARWYLNAAQLPNADDEVKRLAREFRKHALTPR